jgi:hypothetical protein
MLEKDLLGYLARGLGLPPVEVCAEPLANAGIDLISTTDLRHEAAEKLVVVPLLDVELLPRLGRADVAFRCSMMTMLAKRLTYLRIAAAPLAGSNPGCRSRRNNIAAAVRVSGASVLARIRLTGPA